MHFGNWLRWTGLTVAVLALSALLATTARADDDESTAGATTTRTATIVVTKDGTKTIRVVADKDGRFVVVPEEGAPQPAATRKAHPDSPMSSVMKWMMRTHDGFHGGKDPITAWFEGGPDVPLADLRDTLVADGWDAPSLIQWLHGDLGQVMATLLAPALAGEHPVGPPPAAWTAKRAPQRGWGMERRRMMPRWMDRRGGWAPPGRGPGPQAGPWAGPHGSPDVIVLVNDGHGWQQVPAGRMPGPMVGPGPEGRCDDCECECHRARGGEDRPGPQRRMRRPAEGMHGVFDLRDLDDLPPELRRLIEEALPRHQSEAIRGRAGAMVFPGGARAGDELDSLEDDLKGIIGELGVLLPTAILRGAREASCGGDCGSCEEKGACGKASAPAKPGCCGQCDGDCDNCPCRDGGKACGDDCGCKSRPADKPGCGTCDGKCEDCPRAAGKPARQGCCGRCGGEAAETK